MKRFEEAVSRQLVKEQMLKYGFHAPDMTVTEFVEDLLPVTPVRFGVLDKIRAEIKEQYGGCGLINDGLDMALSVIDKYIKGEDR